MSKVFVTTMKLGKIGFLNMPLSILGVVLLYVFCQDMCMNIISDVISGIILVAATQHKNDN